MRRREPRIPPMRLAVGAIVVMAAIVYLVFTKDAPFVEGYRIEAVVNSSNQLRGDSPVRIAGVTVGRVVGIGDGPGDARVLELEIEEEARPVHTDARIKIRPRLFLEGGFYVQLQPGTPGAGELADGGRLPLAQTSGPVQLDQVIGALDRPTRDGLQESLRELDVALDEGGAEALAQLPAELGPALADAAHIAEAARGVDRHDLSGAVRNSARVATALASRDRELAALIADLGTATGSLASEGRALGRGLRELDGLFAESEPQLRLLDRALPSARRTLEALRPGLRVSPAVFEDLGDLLVQLRAAGTPGELPRLLSHAAPIVGRLPGLTRRLRALFPRVEEVTDCVRDRATPVLEAKLDDGALSSGRPVWQDLVHGLVGASSATGYDANGDWLRAFGLFDQRTLTGGSSLPSTEHLFEDLHLPINGTRPKPLATTQIPPFRPDQTCREQDPPNLEALVGPPPAPELLEPGR